MRLKKRVVGRNGGNKARIGIDTSVSPHAAPNPFADPVNTVDEDPATRKALYFTIDHTREKKVGAFSLPPLSAAAQCHCHRSAPCSVPPLSATAQCHRSIMIRSHPISDYHAHSHPTTHPNA